MEEGRDGNGEYHTLFLNFKMKNMKRLFKKWKYYLNE